MSTTPVCAAPDASIETRLGGRIESLGGLIIRYGLVLVIGWIGAMKFTAYEAAGIEPLVRNSPLMGWLYGVVSVNAFSAGLGVVELIVAALLALKFASPRAAAVGALLGIGMFATTLSFLLSTPGAFEPSLGGFPALSALPGQFLIKDIVLLGGCVWALGDALKATRA